MRGLDVIGCISSARNFGHIVDKMNIDYSHRELFMKVKKDKSKKFVY
jgi:Zn-finger domain-containing protein